MLNGANTGLIGADARRNSGTWPAAAPAAWRLVQPAARGGEALALSAEPVALSAMPRRAAIWAARQGVVDNLTWPGKPVPPAPKNTRTAEEEACSRPAKASMPPIAPAAIRIKARARRVSPPALAAPSSSPAVPTWRCACC
jgi:hypothetical protein